MMPEIPPDLAKRFRLVCPIWAERIMSDGFNTVKLRKEFIAGGKKWHISSWCCGIISEAHGRPADPGFGHYYYNCKICSGISRMDYVFDPDWIVTLERFLDHWEEAHAMVVLA